MGAQESRLLDYLQQVEAQPDGRHAARVELSALSPRSRTAQQVRIAANTFEEVTRSVEGRLFHLSNNDLVFVFKRNALDEVRSAIVKLRFMFSDDPLMASEEEGEGDGYFVTWYNLESEDFGALLSLVQGLAVEEKGREQGPGIGAASRAETPADRGTPLTAKLLGEVERSLQLADLTNLMRRQSICAVVGRSPPQRLFSEVFVSIADLREALCPGVDLLSSRWLFQHLTESLDLRVLAMLNKRDSMSMSGEVSVNINIATLLSPEFLKFDENIKASMRGSIVLELQPIDIFGDLSTYLFARDFAHERGYRVCVDGLTTHNVGLIDRARLGADMIKIVTSPELSQWAREADGGPGRERIKRVGASRIIQTRCDEQSQVEDGQKLGIQLFQGRQVERLINEDEERRQRDLVRKARGLDKGGRKASS